MTLQMSYQEKFEQGIEQGIEREKIETVKRLVRLGTISLEDIARGTGLPIEKVKEIAKL